MYALKTDTTINDSAADVLPSLRPFVGHRVELIVLDLGPAEEAGDATEKINLETFIASRPIWPQERPPLSLEDMEDAISAGAS